jgi:hypothetical protein
VKRFQTKAATVAVDVTFLVIDYVEMCRIFGPLPFRDFCAGYASYEAWTAEEEPEELDGDLSVFEGVCVN